MRVRYTAIMQLNGKVIERPREVDNRDLSSMAEYYKARAEVLEDELKRKEGELQRTREFLLRRIGRKK